VSSEDASADLPKGGDIVDLATPFPRADAIMRRQLSVELLRHTRKEMKS